MNKIMSHEVSTDEVLVSSYNVATLEELNIISNELDANFNMLDNVDAYMVALESKKVQLEKMLTAPVNQDTLKMSLEHVNFIYDLLGLPQVNISNENYGSTHDGEVALEGIMDNIKKAGVAVKDTIAKIIKSIIKFFKKIWNFIFGANKKTEERVKKVKTVKDYEAEFSDTVKETINKSENKVDELMKKMKDKKFTISKDSPSDSLNENLTNITEDNVEEKVDNLVKVQDNFRDELIKLVPNFIENYKGYIFDNKDDIHSYLAHNAASIMDSILIIDNASEYGFVFDSNRIESFKLLKGARFAENGVMTISSVGASYVVGHSNEPSTYDNRKITFSKYAQHTRNSAFKNKDNIGLPVQADLNNIAELDFGTVLKNIPKTADDLIVKIDEISKELRMLFINDNKKDLNTSYWDKYKLTNTYGEYTLEKGKVYKKITQYNIKEFLKLLKSIPEMLMFIDKTRNVILDGGLISK